MLTVKLNKFLKRCAVPIVLSVLVYFQSHAHERDLQLLDKEISVKLVDVPFENALKEIESAANVKFVYSLDQLNIRETVSLEVTKQPLRNVLNSILTPLHVKYKVHEKESSISLKKENADGKNEPGQ